MSYLMHNPPNGGGNDCLHKWEPVADKPGTEQCKFCFAYWPHVEKKRAIPMGAQ